MATQKATVSLLDRLTRFGRQVPVGDALYRAVVAAARTPDWYVQGEVPDTVDGRFDIVALMLGLVLLRLERDGAAQAQFFADLTERFIADMDGSLRELGVGDQNVGKHVGRMVSALGGRLGAYRDALANGALPSALPEALQRNVYRAAAVEPAALDWLTGEVRTRWAALEALPTARLLAGQLA